MEKREKRNASSFISQRIPNKESRKSGKKNIMQTDLHTIMGIKSKTYLKQDPSIKTVRIPQNILEECPFKKEKLKFNFFLALANGSKEEFDFIKELIEKDPKRYTRNPGDPDLIVNKPNANGQTPLYIACQNGNLEIVKLLCAFSANMKEKSYVDNKTPESNLEVAARWGHINILEYQLENYKWDAEEIKAAKKKSRYELVKKTLNNSKKNKRFSFFSKK